MSAVFSPRTRCNSVRVLAATAIAAVGIGALVSVGAGWHLAHADVHILRIQSASVVGPLSGVSLAPAVRIEIPLPESLPPVAHESEPAVANQSTCRNDLPNEVMTITIPDISYSCPVYAGGQSMLNSGAATLITDAAIKSVQADHPGGPGVLWVAGHRVSHGGAFASIPNLADGALITVADGTNTATYRVVGRVYVAVKNDQVVDAHGHATGEATIDSILRADHGGNKASRLLLQTCDGDTHRWMIYADLVTA
jgi:sortase (surface protein transpeptidase)